MMSTKMAAGWMTFPVNLTLTYYFETFVIVTWRKQPQATLCKQKVAAGWMTTPLNLTLTCYYFETLLLSRVVNSLRRCYVNNEVDSVMPYLTQLWTCYGKKAPFWILVNMAARAVSFNFVIILKPCYARRM